MHPAHEATTSPTATNETAAAPRVRARMRFAAYKRLLFADLYRYAGSASWRTLFVRYLRGESLRYVFWFRTCTYTRQHPVLKWLVYIPFARWMLKRYRYKLGISIRVDSPIGPGLYVGHFSGIFISDLSPIGRNCNISQGVTIGHANRGPRKGVPTIGDNVYIGPGAKVFGRVRIGNNVAIGANAVVTRDVPDNAVVGGSPARIINHDGADAYLQNTDYEEEPWFATQRHMLHGTNRASHQ